MCKHEVSPQDCEEPTSRGVRCLACRDAAKEKRKEQNRRASKKHRDVLLGDTETHRICDICGFKLSKIEFNKDGRGCSVTCLRCEPEKERRREEALQAEEKRKWEEQEKKDQERLKRLQEKARKWESDAGPGPVLDLDEEENL